jgi:hypothetical protein
LKLIFFPCHDAEVQVHGNLMEEVNWCCKRRQEKATWTLGQEDDASFGTRERRASNLVRCFFFKLGWLSGGAGLSVSGPGYRTFISERGLVW